MLRFVIKGLHCTIKCCRCVLSMSYHYDSYLMNLDITYQEGMFRYHSPSSAHTSHTEN